MHLVGHRECAEREQATDFFSKKSMLMPDPNSSVIEPFTAKK